MALMPLALAFTLVEHHPLGSMNRARRAIYSALAELRRTEDDP